ncbi:MAG: preprotein translocase subunit SecG [Candidatus Marinimicrobia bacterium]|nr:preprotein translocase subunit SecG [Candidatus Neomarinimicrobiota bacterium]|tara:strand:+ start:1056 stop:1421 length:366 start_codon:yes stop_codon:yes gene_type:complete
MIYYTVVFVMVIISLMLVGVILLQQSKSGGMGTAMGQSAMSAAFGGQGADKLLTKITAILAGSWMSLALLINFLNHPDVDVNIGSESVVTQRELPVESIVSEPLIPSTTLNEDVVPADTSK